MNTKISILSIILMIYSSCNQKPKNEEIQQKSDSNVVELNEAQLKNVIIEVDSITKSILPIIIKLNGTVKSPPQNIVSVSAPLGGYIKSTKLITGMAVKKGAVIAIIQDPQFIQLQQDYLTAIVNLQSTAKEFNRQKLLNTNKAVSDKAFENTETSYRSQKILVASLAERLKLININPSRLNESNISSNINIYSPINGFVSKVNVNNGKFVNPSDIIFELIDPQNMYLSLNIFEKDISTIQIGQKLMAYSNSAPTHKYNGTVNLVGKDLAENGSTSIQCNFESYDDKLIPGMYMNAEIAVLSKSEFTIPDEGLVRFEGKEYVFIQILKGKFAFTEVQTKNSLNGRTQIEFTKPIDPSKHQFVTKGAYTLLMALKNTAEE
jgi:membrane fusion protein, heavy metal efflux system